MAALCHVDLFQHVGAQAIKNPGGYFRAYIRMIAERRVDLVEEIAAMKRRRSH
ncbi:hypothetical protein NKI41_13560 [Mesorhizobium sp. M0601]|uniref:hypothetical protein n=1 Tax=Mesorhizobium sp. M0601 TaxID=2956969 RepID=UPI00333C036A